MLIDTTAMLQGVSDAQMDKKISDKFADKIRVAVQKISFYGPTGRTICDYNELLKILAGIEPSHYIELVHLWQRLGNSLASGISVAANLREA